MPRSLPATLIGVLCFGLMTVALLLSFAALLPVAALKLLVPVPAIRARLSQFGMERIAGELWWGLNRAIYVTLHGPRTDFIVDGTLDRNKSWLVICNHQSWADIPILVDLLGQHMPFPRFFLKRELLWVPIIGFVCWAFDMPFMKRHSRAAIAANPALQQQDLEATRAACEKFRSMPVTVVNFAEGTRSTAAKRAARGSPYRHLLRPKAAGLSFTLNAMGDQFAGIVDVTLYYAPSPSSGVWSFLCGDQRELRARAHVLPLPAGLVCGDYQTDAEFRARFQVWLNALWARKDQELDELAAAADRFDRVPA
jgi:1-acyl-sn-glycerol-3-phosphate acyltransferase